MPATSPPQTYTSLPFPLGGVNRRLAFARNGHGFLVDANNVIPQDAILARSRGGSRPGLASYGSVSGRGLMATELRWASGTLPSTSFFSNYVIGCSGGIFFDTGGGSWSGWAADITDRVYQAACYKSLLFYPTKKVDSSTHPTYGSLAVYQPRTGSVGDLTTTGIFGEYTQSADADLIEPTSLGAFAGGTIAIAAGVVTLTPDSVPSGDDTPAWPFWSAISGILNVFEADGSTSVYRIASRDSDTQLTLTDLTVTDAGPLLFSLQSRFGVSYQQQIDAGGTEHAVPPPSYCTLVAVYNDRIVMSGDASDGQAIYFSAAGDYRDWRFGATGGASDAVALVAHADGGSQADVVTALIPYKDSSLIIGMRASISVLHGNPAGGGLIQNLVNGVGILSASAFCFDDEGRLWFMSSLGLYRLDPGAMSTPIPVSSVYLPKELLGIDPSVYDVWLAYDVAYGGLLLHVVPISAGNPVRYFVDLRSVALTSDGNALQAAFYPLSYGANNVGALFARPYFREAAGIAQVLQVQVDGAVKYWDSTVACESNWYYEHLIPLAPDNYVGVLDDLRLFVAANSFGFVSISVRTGTSAEEAFNSGSSTSYNFVLAGINNTYRPRLTGTHAILRVKNTAGSTKTAIEDLRYRARTIKPLHHP